MSITDEGDYAKMDDETEDFDDEIEDFDDETDDDTEIEEEPKLKYVQMEEKDRLPRVNKQNRPPIRPQDVPKPEIQRGRPSHKQQQAQPQQKAQLAPEKIEDEWQHYPKVELQGQFANAATQEVVERDELIRRIANDVALIKKRVM